MFLKRNLARFNFPSEMYSTEVRIYRDVLPGLAIEKPDVYAVDAADDDIAFTILMEDLGARPGARLGIVTEPTTPDEVDGVFKTLATLHAAWWGGARMDAEASWLTPASSNPPMTFWSEIGPRLSRKHRSEGHRAAMVDPDRWPEERIWSAFGTLVAALDTGPPTLLHGDVHAGNVFYVDGVRGGLLDWQLALRGNWSLDVTYILSTALTPEQRAAHERDLLRGYLDRLSALGVPDPPTFDEAWLRYRQSALYGIAMWLITPGGVHSDAAQAENLGRCLAAGDALETLAALGV
jgi:aminoglycoside/choline kinase family phosphotransferase